MKTVFDLSFVFTFSICLTTSVSLQSQQQRFNDEHQPFVRQEAKEFNSSVREEELRILSLTVDKIDNDKNGLVTHEELMEWIKYMQARSIMNNVHRKWARLQNDEKLSWSDYSKDTYGFMTDEEAANDHPMFHTFDEMLLKDKKRWVAADVNKDGLLSKKEFVFFLHPEQGLHMKDIVIQEIMDDMDIDKDKKLSMDECIAVLIRDVEPKEVSNFIINEKEQFKMYRDKDGDGYLDFVETKHWLLPDNFDRAAAESRYLVYKTDSNTDGKLTKDEIIKKYDLFVGLQDADIGEEVMEHVEL